LTVSNDTGVLPFSI